MGGRGSGRQISEFETSLVYRVSSRTARATQRNPVSKKPNPKNQKTRKKKEEEEKEKESQATQPQHAVDLAEIHTVSLSPT